MAKNKELKKETIKRLGDLITKHGYETKEELVASEKYVSLHDNYMNAFEKQNASFIIDQVYKGFDFDEIKLLLKDNDKEDKSVKKNTKESATKNEEKKSPMEEANEQVFMISQQKVVEVDPVGVIIGDEKLEGGDAANTEDTIIDIEEETEAEAIFMATEGKVVDVNESGKVVDTDVSEDNKSEDNQGETTTESKKTKKRTYTLLDEIKVAFDTSPLGVLFGFIGAKPVPEKEPVTES